MHTESRRPCATTVPPVALIIAGIVFHTGGVQTAIIDGYQRKEAGIVSVLVLLAALFDTEFTVVMGAIWTAGTAALCIAGTPFVFDGI